MSLMCNIVSPVNHCCVGETDSVFALETPGNPLTFSGGTSFPSSCMAPRGALPSSVLAERVGGRPSVRTEGSHIENNTVRVHIS